MNFLSILGLAGGVLASRKQYITGREAVDRAESRLEDFQFQDLSADLTEEYKVPVQLQEQQLQQIAQRRADIADLARTGSVAEGAGRISKRDFIRFIHISFGSLNELESLLHLARELNYLDINNHKKIQNQIRKVGNFLGGLKRYLEK